MITITTNRFIPTRFAATTYGPIFARHIATLYDLDITESEALALLSS